jgi:tRNA A-37 threonylcarbamoyl transferase component Bud32
MPIRSRLAMTMTAEPVLTHSDALVRAHPRRRPSGEPPPLPRRINASGKWWAAFAVLVAVFLVFFPLYAEVAVRLEMIDHALLDAITSIRTPWLTRAAKLINAPATGWGLQAIWLANLVVLVVWRRWRHLVVWLGAGLLVDNLCLMVAGLLQRPRPLGVRIIGDWSGYALPSVPLAVLSAFLVSTLYANVPAGRLRERLKLAVAALLILVAAARLYLAQEAPSDALFGVVIGVALALLAFRVFASSEVFPVHYRRGRAAHLPIDEVRRTAIERAVEDQLGLIPIEIVPHGLEGSGGSTPLRIKVKAAEDTYVFGKLYAATHLRADRWYKFGRALLYGRLEDEKPFNTVRRLVQYEDYVLRLLRTAELPVPCPYGIVELTPEREYLLVMEFFDGASEIGGADIDDDVIDQGLRVVREMWEHGLAHRDIKPANVLVRDRRLLLIDSAFAEQRPSPWRQAVDLANMMLVLALRTTPERVYDRTKLLFSETEIAEAFAATRGLTMPSQLRRLLRTQGQDIHAQFLALLPYRLPPVRIQRWTLRRTVLSIAVLGSGVIAALLGLELLVNSPI